VKFSNLTQIAQGTTLSIDVSGYDTQTYVAPKTVNGVNDVVASLNASFKGVTVFASGEDVVIATKDANTTVRASLQAKRPESHTHVEPTINLGGTTVRASVLRDARIVPNNQSADGDLFEEVYGAINTLSSTQGRTTSNFTALADKLKALDALLESRHANTRLFADAIENVAKTNFARSSTSGSGSNTADVSLTQLAIETKNAIKASILNNPELSIASIRNASQQMTLTLIEDLTTGTSFMSITKLGASDAASRADRLREFVEATTKADQTLGTTIVERVQATQQSADFRRPQSPLLSD